MKGSPVFPRLAVVALVLLPLTGCVASVLPLPESSALYGKVKADKDLAEKFLRCSAQAYRERPASGDSHVAPAPATDDATALKVAVDESPSLKADAEAGSLLELVRDMADPAKRKIDLRRLARLAELAKRLHATLRFDEDRLAEDKSLFARLLLVYNKAYFGDLTFKAESTAPGVSIRGVIKVTSAGFVDRNGNAFVFPGLSFEIETTPQKDRPVRFQAGEVDSRRVASDLVRIFLEALLDAAFRVPAAQSATALQVTSGPNDLPYPMFDADHPPITLEQFARVSRDALRAEASVTSAVGQAVRGAGVFGTNNETLAATLETAGGVIAKKLVEHQLFCYFLVTGPAGRTADQTQPPAGGQLPVAVPR